MTGLFLYDVIGGLDALDGVAPLPDDAIELVDPSTIRINLAKPDSAFDLKLTGPELGIVKQSNVEASTADALWWQTPVTSGPFQIESYTPDQELVVVPNEFYFSGRPALDEVVFTIQEDSSTAQILYEAGEMDIVKVLPQNRSEVSESALGDQLLYADAVYTNVAFFNPKAPYCDDVHVNRALNLSLDREAITSLLLEGQYEPATTFSSPVMPGYDSTGFNGVTFDPEAAVAELALSGYDPSEIAIKVWFSPVVGSLPAQAIAAIWEDTLGITTEIVPELNAADAPESEAICIILGGQSPFTLAWGSPMRQWLDYSAGFGDGVHVDFGNYQEVIEPLRDIVDRAESASTSKEAWAITMEGENLLVEYPNWMPIWYDPTLWLVNPKVEGLRPGLFTNWVGLESATISN